MIPLEVNLFESSKLTVPKISDISSEGDQVQIGIRPEHILVNQEGDASWESKVFVVEKLGSGTFLYLEKEGGALSCGSGWRFEYQSRRYC